MDHIRNIYRKVTLLMVTVLFITLCIAYIYFTVNTSRAYEERAVQSILDVKKEFLKSIIDNLILEIGVVQEEETQYYNKRVKSTSQILQEYYSRSPENYIQLFINFSNTGGNKESLSVLIRDTKLDRVIYKSGFFIKNYPKEEDFSCYYQEEYDDYEISFGVPNDYIDSITKRKIATRIRSREYSQNSYIWVNEIKNYEGGENYAIRAIHPNLPETEGEYLSTDVKDVKGNFPYRVELEGVKTEGEVFFNYYFKKKDSNVVSQKITYARLYKEYDWVLAMGVHLDEIESYIAFTKQENRAFIMKIMVNTTFFMLSIFFLYWLLISQIEKWYYKNYNKKLKEEIFIDPLTKTKNRRAALIYLESTFNEFKKTGQAPMIMMIDIDDFKRINDTYGHFEGDTVLQNVVETINDHIRGTDMLSRWGGEEFLLICNGLKEKDVMVFTNKIITLVGSKEYMYNGEIYHATISMGIDKFAPGDKTYEDSIKRADIAMYDAKGQGKNRACTGSMCWDNPIDH